MWEYDGIWVIMSCVIYINIFIHMSLLYYMYLYMICTVSFILKLLHVLIASICFKYVCMVCDTDMANNKMRFVFHSIA